MLCCQEVLHPGDLLPTGRSQGRCASTMVPGAPPIKVPQPPTMAPASTTTTRPAGITSCARIEAVTTRAGILVIAADNAARW